MRVKIKFDDYESHLEKLELTTYGETKEDHLCYFIIDLAKRCYVRLDKIFTQLAEYVDEKEFDEWYLGIDHSKYAEKLKAISEADTQEGD